MNIYNYHPVTKEYLGPGIADASPLEEDVYLMPAHATAVAPPATGDREAAVWDGAWTLVPDQRGVQYFLPDGTSATITQLGVDLPAGATLVRPAPAPAVVKSAGRRRVDGAAEAARLQFITSGAGQALVYQRKEAQARDCRAAHDANNPPPAGKYPALDAEIGATGADALSVAQVVVGLADAWGAIADQIEALRLTAKAAIAAIPDDAADIEAQIAAIEAGINWPTA